MDAPTTTSADNGTSGENGARGGGGWFTPRKQPADGPAASGVEVTAGEGARPAGDGRIATPSRPVASIRPVGTGAERAAGAPPREVTGPRAVSAPTAPPPPAVTPHATPAQPAPYGGGAATPASPPHGFGNGTSPRNASRQHDATPHGRTLPHRSAAPHPAHQADPALGGAAPHDRPATASDRPAAGLFPGVSDHNASPDAILIRRTMEEIAPVADKVTSYFYALLFVRHPDLRALFPAAMDTQRDRLLKALLTAAEHMDNTPVLVDYLEHLGRGHRKYGTQPAHYPAVGEALIGALTRYAATTWNEETEAAWVRAYTTISQIMIDSAAEDERHAPAWWHAEVVSHDLRTPDIAVVTVRPDQPYPFLAGQYTSLETPWWPRIWRHYSFAGAPRSDGLLSFHVKAVPAGWVSNALVHHARPGDVLRLGPPAGSMVVDHTTDNGMLCLGGGTGIAPIKALVEDVAEHGERRPVEVFYGARSDHDLYDIDTMLRLQQSHPWLQVRPVVDGRTQLPDAVLEYGPWNEYDAFLSGPIGMIRSGVDTLRGVGIPSERIRHDSLEELVAAAD
ncbi:globin domain-containing protein [Streptomyces tirandamycinicus]|uniref:nitric oxide dioxygenase n=1 Tax=Streptomyces tirandamycinicus TaxID=2174846 RepID=A0A2S1SU43_9ACTN|nr:globin domain-containing protein [Streptomyces tirandamycinicus]AWI29910.1 flavohemoprotein [Streptomyces tirandamycinicus]